MNKEDVCVLIDSEEKRLRLLEILEQTGEKVWKYSHLNRSYNNLVYTAGHVGDEYWVMLDCGTGRQEITLDELEQLLTQQRNQEDEIDKLRQHAEALGFELLEKKREIKVGDFGIFWDNRYMNHRLYCFLSKIENNKFLNKNNVSWDNFRHLTEEEKTKIQESW